MLKYLKLNNTTPENIFFTGCLHIFHKQEFIWKARGHDSVDSHAKGVLAKINEVVGYNDILFILGDTFLNAPDTDVCYEWLRGIKCNNVYIQFGNHNAGISSLCKRAWGDGPETYPIEILPGKYVMGHYIEAEIDRKNCVLSHFPFAIWNNSHHGSFNLHSHCHGSFVESLPENKCCKRLDVGWDVFAKPISFAEIRKIMNEKDVAVLDHHNSTTT